ncbi:unannotated protein [freshwater metagenome]|uniref:Unannotated protein n=1 Tax=freshwater metagenome TaxID=449393 RepID=A0A6J7E9Y5_9ZZZZ
MDDRHLRGELRQEDRLLHRRIATADDHRLPADEEGCVAGRAVAHAAAAQCLLARHPDLPVLCTHREYNGARLERVRADADAVHAARSVGELELRRQIGDETGAEALGLIAHLLHQLGAHHAARKSREVLNVGRLLEQTAPHEALDDERSQVGAGRVKRGRVAGWAAADNDDVLDLAHGVWVLWEVGTVGSGCIAVDPPASAAASAAASSAVSGAPSSRQRSTVLRSCR